MKGICNLPIPSIALLALILSMLVACGTFEMSVEHTVIPNQVAPATLAVIATESAQLMMQVTPQATPVPVPTPVTPWPGMVYRMADGLWQMTFGGEHAPIFDRTDALLSPDGTRALYLEKEAGDFDLWLADLITGERHNLTKTPDRTEGNFRWWPARPDVVLFSSLPQEIAPGPGVNGFLTVAGMDGAPLEQGDGYRVLDAQNHTGGLPAPSPDGEMIAYGSGSTAWLYRWGTGSEVFDPASYGLAGIPDLHIGSPAWSPDSTRLAWVIGGNFTADTGFQMGVAVFDLEARTAQIMHLYEPVGGDGWPAAPVWSPDGKWLAFIAWSENYDESGIWVVQADGQQDEAVHLAGSGPMWSPDGRWLAFRHVPQNEETSHRLAAVGTWTLLQLNLPPDAFLVDWFDAGIERAATPVQVANATPTPTAYEDLSPGLVFSNSEEATPEAQAATPIASSDTIADLRPTPTSVLDGSHLSFNDPALGLGLDIPLWWKTHSTPGVVTRFYQRDHTGADRSVLTLSALDPTSNTLESALEEMAQGTWGPYIRHFQPVTLGAFEALRLELTLDAGRPPVIWLVVAPSGLVVSIVPDVDPSWIEPMIEVVLDTLHPIPVTPRAVSTPEPPPTFTPAPTPLLLQEGDFRSLGFRPVLDAWTWVSLINM